MTADDRVNWTVSVWLRRRAGSSAPDYLDDILGLTSRTRQRPAWTILERWPPADMGSARRLSAYLGWRSVALLAILALVLAAFVVAAIGSRTRLPPPFGTAANGMIAFSANGAIMAVDPDGDNVRTLMDGPPGLVWPEISNDGTRLLVTRRVTEEENQVFISDADGANLRAVTPRYRVYGTAANDGEPAFGTAAGLSPDNAHLLMLRRQRPIGPATLSILSTDGSGDPRDLELADGTHAIDVLWVWWLPPEGREIAFVGGTNDEVSLFAVRTDGTGLRRLTPARPVDTSYSNPYGEIDLSPDGTRAVYSTYHEFPAPRSEVRVLDLNTGSDVPIATDANYTFDDSPSFSPDGRSILFVRYGEYRAAKLMVVAADGSGVARQVGSDSGGYAHAGVGFSPDGSKILVEYAPAIWNGIDVIDVATGRVDRISERGRSATWQRTAP